jgi:phage-related minor tail protein
MAFNISRTISAYCGISLRALGVVVAALAATQIPALVAVLATKTAGMTAASIAAGIMATAMRGLAAAVVFLGGPLGLVLGITGGLTAAMVLFRDTTDTVAPIMDSARDAIDRINSVSCDFVESQSRCPQQPEKL